MRSVFAFALVMACAISNYAQEKTLTEAEFSAVNTKAHSELLRGVKGPIRQTMETESVIEGRPETDYRLTSLLMSVPGKGTHRVEERTFGGKRTVSEWVTVDGRQFWIEGDGMWKEILQKPAGSEAATPGSTQTASAEKRAEFKYMGLQTIGNKKAHVYTKSEWRKTVDEAKGTSYETETTAKVFVGEDGNYYRFESDAVNHLKNGTGRLKIRIDVVVDPTITIKAPEIAK